LRLVLSPVMGIGASILCQRFGDRQARSKSA